MTHSITYVDSYRKSVQASFLLVAISRPCDKFPRAEHRAGSLRLRTLRKDLLFASVRLFAVKSDNRDNTVALETRALQQLAS